MSARKVKYYQLAGFEGHGNRWFERDTDDLARIIFYALQPNPSDIQVFEPIDLVFGVRENGESYILATDEQIAQVEIQAFEKFTRGSKAPFEATAFVSLSPITFSSRAELKESLKKTYAGPRKGSNKKYLQGPSTDYSRADFEQNRNLYRILSRSISLRTFDLSDFICNISTRIVSLAFTVWEPHSQTQRRILGAGWTEMSLRKDDPSDLKTLDTSSISNVSHFDCTDFRLRIRGKGPAEFKYGEKKSGSLKHLQAELNSLLSVEKDKTLILLVHKKAQVLSIFKEFDLDLSDHIDVDAAVKLEPSDGLAGFRYLILDVQELFCSLSRLWNDITIPRIARDLGFDADLETYCAGNESRLLLLCWLKMSSGDIIDRQAELREKTIRAQQGSSSKRKREDTPEEDNDEIDANNIPQKRPAPVRTKPGQLLPPTDDDDDDDF